jgi:hypothetical protein
MEPIIQCMGCQAKVPSSTIKSGLCKICRAPNDLIIAAMDLKVKRLMGMNQMALVVMLVILSTFTLCWFPILIASQVDCFVGFAVILDGINEQFYLY